MYALCTCIQVFKLFNSKLFLIVQHTGINKFSWKVFQKYFKSFFANITVPANLSEWMYRLGISWSMQCVSTMNTNIYIYIFDIPSLLTVAKLCKWIVYFCSVVLNKIETNLQVLTVYSFSQIRIYKIKNYVHMWQIKELPIWCDNLHFFPVKKSPRHRTFENTGTFYQVQRLLIICLFRWSSCQGISANFRKGL